MEISVELQQIQEELQREFICFPHGCCAEASKRVSNLRLEKVYGLFVDDNGVGHNHSWNKNEGKIYDITAFQFSGTIPHIYILDEASQEAQERYIEGVFFMF